MSRDEDIRQAERYVQQLLRSQPLRRAPSTLQERVLAQLDTAPWWRRSFLHWPVAARVAFLLASCGVVRLVMAGAISAANSVSSLPLAHALGQSITWLRTLESLAAATNSTGASILHAIPSLWLYAGAALGVGLYVALFGLGAIAYRTLYIRK